VPEAILAIKAAVDRERRPGRFILTGSSEILRLPPWTPNLTEREIGRAKGCLTGSAIAMRLDRIGVEQLIPVGAPSIGGILEGFAVGELAKQGAWSAEEFEVFHYREKNGLEVDVAIEFADGQVFLDEVKSTQAYSPRPFRSIRVLAAKMGDRFGGIVLGMGKSGLRVGGEPGIGPFPTSSHRWVGRWGQRGDYSSEPG
jgi:predicted AAA+ superfamily ATPase